MKDTSIINVKPLGFPWETKDPFLFCAYHADQYPEGNDQLGPEKSLLTGRNIGQDFDPNAEWRMYHGSEVPGFPSHPHRGFETISIVTEGLVDHADSLGAAGRFGFGDVQWMTAGRGVQHSEMFPLLNKKEANPLEMFQIWLNLPKDKKFAKPHFKMLWSEDIPYLNQNNVEIRLVAGNQGDNKSLDPAPDSWAANPYNAVTVLTAKVKPGAKWEIPTLSGEKTEEISQTLYFYAGDQVNLDGNNILVNHSIEIDSNQTSAIENNGQEDACFLFLQGRAINEPIARYGPFVMNSQQEIMEAMDDYRRTEFGGWPWGKHDQVHSDELGRFAKHADGKEEFKS